MKRSIIVKFLAILLCAAFLLVGAGAALGVGMLASLGLYEKSVSEYRQEVELQRAYDFADSLIAAYASRTLGGCPEELVQDYYGMRYSYTDYYRNLLAYQILDADGTLLDYDGDLSGSWTEVEWASSYVVYLGDYEEPSVEEATGPHRTDDPTGTAHYDVTEPVREYEGYVYGYYDPELQSHREVWLKTETSPVYTVRVLLTDQATDRAGVLLDLLHAYRMDLFWILGVGLLLFAVLLVWLCCAAGHGKGPTVHPGGLNRMPLELYAGIVAAGGTAAAFLIVEGGEYLSRQSVPATVAFCAVCAYLVCLLLVGFIFAFAAQVKTPGGFWWRRSLLCLGCRLIAFLWNCFLKVLAWCWDKVLRFVKWWAPLVKRCFVALWKVTCFFASKISHWLRRVERLIGRSIGLLPLTWQWVVGGILMVLIWVLVAAAHSAVAVCLGVLITAAAIFYISGSFGILLESAKRMRRGDLDSKAEDRYLVGCFREFAQELNGLTDVVAAAAQDKLKSERMKTELITNVSHDIKTPLTSIINYVDLLGKPHTAEEQAQYLEVLRRQSQRLKKLIDDLMELSKASSGNITVELGEVDAVEMMDQALGEFSDKLDRVPLYPVFRQPEEPHMMRADGRLVWRVLSNVLGNACKYALPGTRLYVDVARAGEDVIISLKNISREELNVNAEELMERFVRGDISRNTEGSGLGLNIAKSLMEVQGGQLRILVDGDLFKVTLIFPGINVQK